MEVTGHLHALATYSPRERTLVYRRLGEAHRQSGHGCKERNSLPLVGIESQSSSP